MAKNRFSLARWLKPVDVIHKLVELLAGKRQVVFAVLALPGILSRMMIEPGLTKKYSIPSLLLTLSRVKQVELSDGSMMITEIPKEQRLIFEKLDVQP